MIGLDTNVLIRYIVQDDVGQSARATRLVEGLDEDAQGYVSLVVLVEVHWVLRRVYRSSRDEAAQVVRGLLDAKELRVQADETVRRALNRAEDDVDFTDALICELAKDAGCEATATFDDHAARLDGMCLVPSIDGDEETHRGDG